MRYILLLFVILISYGSLYPYYFSSELLSSTDTINWLMNGSYHTTRSDIVANIFLISGLITWAISQLEKVAKEKRALILK